MSHSITCVTIASRLIGMGHLKRCLTIAKKIIDDGGSVEFLILGEESGRQLVCNAGINEECCRVFELHEYELVYELLSNAHCIVDILCIDIHKMLHVGSFFKGMSARAKTITAIDSMGGESIYSKGLVDDIDILIIPYVGAPTTTLQGSCRILSGPRYAILGQEYEDANVPGINCRVDTILISCGGSDPKDITLSLLECFRIHELSKLDLNIGVVTGPLFSARQTERINAIARDLPQDVEIYESPSSLVSLIENADIVISASGLTKYEAASLGKPMILFSIDYEHFLLNSHFRNRGLCIDIGVGIQQESFVSSLLGLVSSYEARKLLSARSRGAVSRRGTSFLVKEIVRLISKR